MPIEAVTVLDSVSDGGNRLLTMRCRYPKFVHGEHLRHRALSFSVSSSRAVPVWKNLEEVRSEDLRAGPVWWGREKKGMSSGDKLADASLRTARSTWRSAALTAADAAEKLALAGAHKSIVNRVLEPFLHVNVLVTGAAPGWLNFFGLRLDAAAQPEIRALAQECWRAWNLEDSHAQQTLRPGEWHLPFVDDEYRSDDDLQTLLKISTACCAHLSYESFETGARMTVEHCLRIYDKLIGSVPIHASPAEHQATPDEWLPNANFGRGCWFQPELAGNFGPGWVQHRKMLPGEAIAPLPERYR